MLMNLEISLFEKPLHPYKRYIHTLLPRYVLKTEIDQQLYIYQNSLSSTLNSFI